jgi:hypothetical protein
MRALPDDGSSALCLLNEWSAGVDERLVDNVRRIDGQQLKGIEPIL